MDQANPNPAAVPGAEENGGPGYDCSSATSYVLWGGGLGQSMLGGGVDDSTALEGVGDPGPGKWVTIYANAGHAYIEVAGVYFDTAAGLGYPPNPPPTGPRWSTVGTGPAGFVARHPPGLWYWGGVCASGRRGCLAGMYLEHIALIVDDYDEAIRFFVEALGFELVED
jgi:hypothetical protein